MPEKMPQPADPFRMLATVEPGVLLLAIAGGRPATIALVLSHLPAALAVQIAGKLDDDARQRVLRCLASQRNCCPEIAADVAQTIQNRVEKVTRNGGVACAARIMSECDPEIEWSLLQSLDRRDSQLSAQIRRTLLAFDDIAWFNDDSIQTLLRNVDLKTWAMALKRCRFAIKQKIARNLSVWSARQLCEEIDYLGVAGEPEVQQAQQRIVAVARDLRQPAASRVA